MREALFMRARLRSSYGSSNTFSTSGTVPYKPLHALSGALAIWTGAFTVTYIGNAPCHDLKCNQCKSQQWQEFREAVRRGNILTFRARFDDEPLNRQVRELSREVKQ